jgi:hypothetical protein
MSAMCFRLIFDLKRFLGDFYLKRRFWAVFDSKSNIANHIEPRRGTLKRHKNRGKFLLNILKLIYLIEIIYIQDNLTKII